MKRMTDAEYKEKRDKGLCFRCDEKFSIGHRCKKAEMMLLIANGVDGKEYVEIENEEEGMNEPQLTEITANAIEVAENVELALRSVLGFSTPGTMKLKGEV